MHYPAFTANMMDDHKATEVELLQAEKKLVLELRQLKQTTEACSCEAK